MRTSLTFAIRAEGKFVGEAILYAPDGRGRADIALRVLPEYQRRGYAADTISAIWKIAEKIGLTKLRAKIKNENTPSISLFEKCALFISQNDEVHEYKIEV